MFVLRERYLHLCIVLLAALVTYANVLGGGFIYDDLLQILDNRWLLDPASLPEIFSSHVWGFSPDHSLTNYYRPLMHAANLFVYSLFGPNPVFFHLLSLLLHLGCSVLLFLVVTELCHKFYPQDKAQARFLPFYGALFFAVYPANAEAVAWLGSSGDLLCALFILGSLYFYLCLDRKSRGRYLLISVVLFACALLSKETAVLTAPLLIFMVDLAAGHLSSRRGLKEALLHYLPYAVVGLLYLWVRVSVLGGLIPLQKHTLTGGLFFVSAMQKFLWYIGKLLWPFTHNFMPELPSPASFTIGDIALGTLSVGLVLGVSLFLVWQSRVLLIVSVFFYLPLFSAMQAHVLKDPVAFRYLYLPATGYCLGLAWLMIRFMPWPKMRDGLVVLLVLIWGVTAFSFNRDFVDGVTLWGAAVSQSPHSIVARDNYAKALFDSGRFGEAVEQAQELLAQGYDNPGNIYLLAEGLQKLERFRQAQVYYEQLLIMNPGEAWIHAQLGRVFLSQGDLARALARLEYAVRLDPQNGVIQYWLGRVYEKDGQADKAQAAYRMAIKLLPADAPERVDLSGRVMLEGMTGH